MTVARPGRPAVARPDGLTVTTVLSVLLHAAVATTVPPLVTVSGSDSPARSTVRVAVTWSVPEGEVGVELDEPQPAAASQVRARAAASAGTRKRSVTARL